jgi:glycosyltransferase involved in cell wall biosynthesis
VKLLFLCKRRPQGRDLLTRPYGRFFYIPNLLARKGHEVSICLLSYKRDRPVKVERDKITWFSECIQPSSPLRYFQRVQELLETIHPDWIIGFSDSYYGIMAAQLGKKFGIRSAIDAYDNYESYIPWLKPLHMLWRRALKQANVVTAAGPQLAKLFKDARPERPVYVVPMAADPMFVPVDRDECRKFLKLPLAEPLIGYCGAVFRSRGIKVLFEAYEELRRTRPETRLVLSGRKERSVRMPDHARWLGYLPDEDLPYLLNAMNLLVVMNQLSAFGRYSYPVKLYEALSCRIPVVATATDPAKWILGHCSRFLATPGDACDLARKISDLLPAQRPDYGEVNDWNKSCQLFEKALLAAA